MHTNIYDTAAATSLYTPEAQLDPALAKPHRRPQGGARRRRRARHSSTRRSSSSRGSSAARSGALNGQAGRDHFAGYSAVFAGGGVKGGQVIGATDATGATIADSGVSGRTELRAEDLACTVYSALGIDWTTMRHDDPLGRGFEYVPYAEAGVYAPIDRLFG